MKGITFTTPGRLSVAMSLIFGLATIAAAPIVEAAPTDVVDIVNGQVDVDQDGILNEPTDDVTNVLFNCNDATWIQVDIINGLVDVTEGGAISGTDDAVNCDLNDLVGTFPSTPSTNEVGIIDGCVDTNEDAMCSVVDDASNVRLSEYRDSRAAPC